MPKIIGNTTSTPTVLSKGDTTGSGNAVTDISVAGHNITLVKGETFIPASKMGVAGGVATIDSSGKIPASMLPSYLDDIVYGVMKGDRFEIKMLVEESPFEDIDYDGYISNPRQRVLYVSEEHTDDYGNIIPTKIYSWNGERYVEIPAGFAGDVGNNEVPDPDMSGFLHSNGSSYEIEQGYLLPDQPDLDGKIMKHTDGSWQAVNCDFAPIIDGKVPSEYLPSSPSSASPYDIIVTSEEQFLSERANFNGKKVLVKGVKFKLAEIDFNNAAYVEFCNVYVGNERSFLTIKNFKIGNFSTLFRGWYVDGKSYYCDNLYIENFSFAENLIPYGNEIHGSGDIIGYSNGFGITNCAISSATNCCNITNCHIITRQSCVFTNCNTISNLHAKDFSGSTITFENCMHLSNIALTGVDVSRVAYTNCSKVCADTCDGYTA